MSRARFEELQALRLRLHRLQPSRPIRDVRTALAFIKERLVVLSTGHSSLPCMADAIAGRHLSGSWMAHPEVYVAYRLLRRVYASPQVASVPLVLGKETFLHSSLGPAVARIAADAHRREMARDQLPPLARRLLADVETRGEVRMDRWRVPTVPARRARLLLERQLMVVSRGLHTEGGYHTALVKPWNGSAVSERFGKTANRLDYGDAVGEILLAAVRSAVIAPEREVRRWFVFGVDWLDALIEQGKLKRIVSDRTGWLTNEVRDKQ